MNEEQEQTQETSPGTSDTSSGSWDEVGRQFQALGESLAAAFRTAWDKEENRQQMQQMKTGLEEMATQVSQAIKDSSSSPAVQQLRSEAKKAASTLQTAGQQTMQEAKPHLLSALRQINEELQKLIDRMAEQEKPAADAPSDESSEQEKSQK